MSEFEEKGYDAWVSQWVKLGRPPFTGECPAFFLKDDERTEFVKGWARANREHLRRDALEC